MPGPPLGPMPRTTSTLPGFTSPRAIAAMAKAQSSNTTAGPENSDLRPAPRSPSLTMALSGASEPCRMVIGCWSE